MKRILIIKFLMFLILVPVSAQTGRQDLKREVTLYNPYKPSLSPVKKRSFLPDMNDTTGINPEFKYDIIIKPFLPEYTISPLKAASLLPDPLPKLYKSWLNVGIGNYITPLAELSITNERSKKGAMGFYARHFSTNGEVKLQNEERVFAGYMDNDISLFGKRFFRDSYLEGSLDFNQETRYAYGHDPGIDYSPENKEIRLNYFNPGANLSFASITLDSASFTYDFSVNYNFFYNTSDLFQHNAGLKGTVSTLYEGFYLGSGAEVDFFSPSKTIYDKLKYIVSVSPFLKKSTSQWSFKAGLQLLLDKNMNDKSDFHFYPDVRFSFNVVPEYASFFTGLNGKLEVNEPKSIIEENPFIVPNGILFSRTNTGYPLIVSAGLNGNTGIGGNYLLSASYSFINDMLFFTNLVFPDSVESPQRGNYFIPLTDDGELLQIHGEMNGLISDKLIYNGSANWYKYTLTENEYPWNKPEWDVRLSLKYNLRDKIIAGVDVTALGKRRLATIVENTLIPQEDPEPVHVNISLNAEYRYTKILSFWLKLNNISFNRFYEWAYYPSQRFTGMVGFTYSL